MLIENLRERSKDAVRRRCAQPVSFGAGERFGLRRSASGGVDAQPAMLDDKIDHLLQALAARQIGKSERPLAAHAGGVALYDIEIDVHIGGEIALVDDQEI